MGDRNLIQLARRGPWHYWNYGSMMPICGAGEMREQTKAPMQFTRSMTSEATGYGQIKNFCPVCVAAETPPATSERDAARARNLELTSAIVNRNAEVERVTRERDAAVARVRELENICAQANPYAQTRAWHESANERIATLEAENAKLKERLAAQTAQDASG